MAPQAASRTRLIVITLAASLLGAGAPIAYAVLHDRGALPSATSHARGRPFIATDLLFGDAAATLSGRPARPATAPRQAVTASIETELLFGTARPDDDQSPVTDTEFRGFVEDTVLPRFPVSLLIQDGYSPFRAPSGTVGYQHVYKLTLIRPAARARRDDRAVEEIRAAYTARFHQPSVPRIDTSAQTRS